MVSRYNIYFNGNESYKRGVKKIDRQFQDDFSKVLPVFKYGNEEIANSIASDMDRAITKASKVIALHSITAKPDTKGKELSDKEKEFYDRSEFNDWVDDSYLLMGKAQTLKHDYFIAIKTFTYLNKEAQEKSVMYESFLWLSFVYNQQEEFEKSRKILVELTEDPEFPEELNPVFFAVYADYYLKQEIYPQALDMLEQALSFEKSKKRKYRLTYILAQVNEKNGNEQQAYKLYAKVVRMNPPYDMTFNARIRQAESFDVTRENVSEIKKILRKMLRDEKNVEFQDQIYYAFGQIALKEQKREEAIEYFKKSAGASIQNNKQKGISYLTIADLYFVSDEYVPAQAYYDSALMNLNSEYPGFEIIAGKAANLTQLVGNIHIIEREDSLQMLAAMTSTNRIAFIDQIITDLREEERKRLEQEAERPYNQSDYYESERRINQQLNQSGNWYFYNPAVVDFGRNEFRKKWGNRELSDNWRRKNKSVSEMNITEIIEGEEGFNPDKQPEVEEDKYKRDYYLKSIPLTDSLMNVSDKRIENAMFAKSSVYMSDLKDYPRAILSFEEFIKRYPNTDHLLSSYYYLYDLNKKTNNPGMSEFYKNQILEKFPQSEFAQVLGDPDYLRKRNEKEMEVYRLYEQIYVAYLNNQYDHVIRECDRAFDIYPHHELLPKFRLLKAYAIGSISDIRTFKLALQEVVESSPDGEEKKRANELIVHFNTIVPELKKEDEQIESKQIYQFLPEESHIVVLAIVKGRVDMNQLVFDLINFNFDKYPQTEFSTEKQTMDNGIRLVTIKGTGNADGAMTYYRALLKENTVAEDLKSTDHKIFIISETNFDVLLKHGELPVYEIFFNNNYKRMLIPELEAVLE